MRRHHRDADDLHRGGCERRETPPPASDAAASEGPGAAAAQPATFEKFVKNTDFADGLFTVIRKVGKVYIAPDKEQLDTSTAGSVQTVAPIAAEERARGRIVIDTSFLLHDASI